MAVKVAINGFGRIGRLAFRQMFGAEGFEIVAINDLTSPKMLAHLLKYDSTQGKYELADKVSAGEDSITVDGKEIKIYAKANAAELPWGEIGVDVVLECTGFYTSKECVEKLSVTLELTEEEKSELLPSGKQTIISNRVSWARFYLEKAGLVKVISRGKYQITQEGVNLLAEHPTIINNDILYRYDQFLEFMKQGSTKGNNDNNNIKSLQPSFTEQTPEEILDSTYKQLQSNLSEEILEKVLQQSPQFFERLVVDLLVKMGYGAGKITGRTGDGGIDGIIDEDKLGLDVIHIQAKRWQIGNNVGRRELQSFVGALAGQSGRKGVFITTSSFTREALEYNPSNVKIAKIDGKKLADLMITYNLGVSTKVLYELKKIDTDYFEE